tara:strand:- start:75400 stop:76440 length:1041 start_codon:yes stop_codon:yes gene_type:complete
MRHFKFPDIAQFRQAIRGVQNKARFAGLDENGDPTYDGLKPLPTIKYRGTVKLHGTNSAICKNLQTGEITLQSRSRVITIEDDNHGFAQFVSGVDVNSVFDLVDTSGEARETEDEGQKDCVVIFGEWCGGNIQKGVALSQLEKMFVIFAIKCKGVWLHDDELKNVKCVDSKVYNVLDYPHYSMEIDFQNPELFQNKLGDITLEVEKECPVGKGFDVEGIGEGVVWVPVDPEWNSSKFWFKVKGEKHSVTKVKKLAAVDIEKVKTVNEFIDKVVTDNRLLQGVEFVKSEKKVSEVSREHIGDFIRWIYNDVIKEETDTIEASGLEAKELGGPIAKRTKEWMFKELGV